MSAVADDAEPFVPEAPGPCMDCGCPTSDANGFPAYDSPTGPFQGWFCDDCIRATALDERGHPIPWEDS